MMIDDSFRYSRLNSRQFRQMLLKSLTRRPEKTAKNFLKQRKKSSAIVTEQTENTVSFSRRNTVISTSFSLTPKLQEPRSELPKKSESNLEILAPLCVIPKGQMNRQCFHKLRQSTSNFNSSHEPLRSSNLQNALSKLRTNLKISKKSLNERQEIDPQPKPKKHFRPQLLRILKLQSKQNHKEEEELIGWEDSDAYPDPFT